ncbi:MAG: hypothetical protein ABIH72_02670 [archaeon]
MAIEEIIEKTSVIKVNSESSDYQPYTNTTFKKSLKSYIKNCFELFNEKGILKYISVPSFS